MAQRTSPTERHVTQAPPRPSRRPPSRRQRRELRKIERQLVGRRWRPWRRRESSGRGISASELDALIARHVQKAVEEERESTWRKAEEEIDRRMDEFTEMMLRRQEKLMARAWQAFRRRARQQRQPAQRKSRAKRTADR